jgi:hypothetical protein
MKKLLFSSLFFISILTIGTDAKAQGLAFNRIGATAVNPYPETASKIITEIDANINAVRDFRRNFANAIDVKWVQHENGVSVYFTMDHIKMRSSYNLKGKYEYSLRYFNESSMPSDLRKRVKSNYYDHTIMIITEVIRNNQNYYLVKMENEKEYLTLKVTEEDMTVFEKTHKI